MSTLGCGDDDHTQRVDPTTTADAAVPDAGFGECTRESLSAAIDAYLRALSAHDAAALPAAVSLKFTENGEPSTLGMGFWQTAGEVMFQRKVLDPELCAAVVQAVVAENGALVILGARLQLAAQQITELETLVVRNGPIPGEASFQPATLLSTPQPTWEEAVPESERSTRQELYAAAEAYCLGFNSSGTDHYQPPPFAPDCNRWENGVKTTNNNCAEQFATIPFGQITSGITRRRYHLADVQNGIAIVFAVFSGIGIDFHMFKVRGGLIHEIQAVVSTPFTGRTGWEEYEAE